MKHRQHKQRGSVIVLIICMMFVLVIPLLILTHQISFYALDRGRVQTAVEGAALLAANDLSRIVLNDPHFGYVSLSNYPASGSATVAGDGEPVPVIGVNTLVGTIRQNTILAFELGNETMVDLADTDHERLNRTIAEINDTLTKSLKENEREIYIDTEGHRVEPFKDVKKYLSSNLPAGATIESLSLTNGWLESGARTDIPLPVPNSLAQVKSSEYRCYKPFCDVPACERPFTFAGLGPSSVLAFTPNFRKADARHICSIVKIDCVVTVPKQSWWLENKNERCPKIAVSQCSQPFSLPDESPAGLLIVHFSHGPSTGLCYWSDLLRDGNFQDRAVWNYSAYNGDYPLDSAARLYPDNGEHTTTTRQFAEHLYYWLRSEHTRPRLDAILSLMNQQFAPGPQTVAYDFAPDGSLHTQTLTQNPFPVGVTAESQSSSVCDTSTQSGAYPVIMFRNYVRHLGTINGGKHAGEPLCGNPPNWSDLPQYAGGADFFKLLKHASGARQSCYSGGLAVDIEIGGNGPSLASMDVARMRKLKR